MGVEYILNRCVFADLQSGASWFGKSPYVRRRERGLCAACTVQRKASDFLFEVLFVQASLEAGKNGHEPPTCSAQHAMSNFP